MKKMKVILADDVLVVRELFVEYISDYCSEILQAENGEEVIEYLKKYNDIDLIITDIEMPLMNGIDVVRYIRTQFPVPKSETIVIGMTCYDTHSIDAFKNMGFDETIGKTNGTYFIVDLLKKYAIE